MEAMSALPSIGKKSALRLILHLADSKTDKTQRLIEALKAVDTNLQQCTTCHNYSDHKTCDICKDPVRNKQLLCVVGSVKDVMAIENTQQFAGVYHILGGVISPLEGIGPEDIHIDSLIERIKAQEVQEVIMALSPTIEGDTTIYYISKLLSGVNQDIKVTTIARGVSFGGELEYADELTLGRSIHSRTDYNKEITL